MTSEQFRQAIADGAIYCVEDNDLAWYYDIPGKLIDECGTRTVDRMAKCKKCYKEVNIFGFKNHYDSTKCRYIASIPLLDRCWGPPSDFQLSGGSTTKWSR